MKAAVLHGIDDLRIEERPQPVPGPGEVLVNVKAIGVCGSDIHWYHEGRIGEKVVTEPLVIGHEAAGEIVQVGADVQGWQAGDRVALEPGLYCRKCDFCKRGDYNLCQNGVYQSSPGADGFFAEYVTMPADKVFRLPDNLDWIEGAMIEPWQVGLQAAYQGEVAPGQAVAVLGAGPIGLFTLQAALARGATNVIVTDVEPRRLALAQELGATHVVNAAKVDAVAEIVRLTGGQGADVVLEAAGAVPTMQQSLYAVRRGGMVVLVGMFSVPNFNLEVLRIVRQGLTLRGVFRYANHYPVAIALAGAGRVNLKAPVTHTFPLEQTKEALDFSMTHKDVAIKVAVTI
jgi:L-iditol 2-dehydrogenase